MLYLTYVAAQVQAGEPGGSRTSARPAKRRGPLQSDEEETGDYKMDADLDAETEGEEDGESDGYEHRSTPQPLEEEEETTEGENELGAFQAKQQPHKQTARTYICQKPHPPSPPPRRELPAAFARRNRQEESEGSHAGRGSTETVEEKEEEDNDDEL